MEEKSDYQVYITKFQSFYDGEIHNHSGKYIIAKSFNDAEEYCKVYFPFLKVEGQLMAGSEKAFVSELY